MLRRFFDRQTGPRMNPPTGPPLTEDELKIGLLREVDLFAGMTSAQLREISQTLPIQTCLVGGLVTSPGDDDERLYIVKRGRVRLYRLTPDGKQLTLEILDKGRIVGRMSWLGPRVASLAAPEDIPPHAVGHGIAHRDDKTLASPRSSDNRRGRPFGRPSDDAGGQPNRD